MVKTGDQHTSHITPSFTSSCPQTLSPALRTFETTYTYIFLYLFAKSLLQQIACLLGPSHSHHQASHPKAATGHKVSLQSEIAS